ncbi:hypothetical protein DCCM_3424 [Desulfocucumis palustris]|uniref:Uncharacterized protein n=1 Tax=Desulfocucumis palustris TaxID=1898651 RepID=A0A2L2XDV4_9FIRM|nr:hypothetical protein DCCM_3424 [Desulfocucumis palustris]
MVDDISVSLGNAPVVTGQISGDALITVEAVPAVVTLANQTGADVLFANTVVQANIAILTASL